MSDLKNAGKNLRFAPILRDYKLFMVINISHNPLVKLMVESSAF